jgi:glycosyltransferase involved in cell wall biosynthesis
MAKFVVLLRVKDGIFFARDWLDCYEKIADEIVVLDNGSTDGTYELLKAHPKVVNIAQTEGYNEGRDKNMLYAHARERKPDWCLWVDIDEIFEPKLTRRDFDKLMRRRWVNKYAFRRFHFIDREHFAGSWYRLKYSSGHDRMMWRESPKGYFENLIIDSPNVKGISGITLYTNFRLKHTGYISKEIVDKKADIYRAIVPEKEDTFQKMYMHNERPIRWIDDRNHIKVIMLNGLLSGIQFMNLCSKAYRKSRKLAGSLWSNSAQPKDLNTTI